MFEVQHAGSNGLNHYQRELGDFGLFSEELVIGDGFFNTFTDCTAIARTLSNQKQPKDL